MTANNPATPEGFTSPATLELELLRGEEEKREDDEIEEFRRSLEVQSV